MKKIATLLFGIIIVLSFSQHIWVSRFHCWNRHDLDGKGNNVLRKVHSHAFPKVFFIHEVHPAISPGQAKNTKFKIFSLRSWQAFAV